MESSILLWWLRIQPRSEKQKRTKRIGHHIVPPPILTHWKIKRKPREQPRLCLNFSRCWELTTPYDSRTYSCASRTTPILFKKNICSCWFVFELFETGLTDYSVWIFHIPLFVLIFSINPPSNSSPFSCAATITLILFMRRMMKEQFFLLLMILFSNFLKQDVLTAPFGYFEFLCLFCFLQSIPKTILVPFLARQQ